MISRSLRVIAVSLLLFLGFQASAQDAPSLIARIKAVGREGAGNGDAAKAWRQLVQQGPEVILDILAGLDDANPRAANWLRSAVDAVAEQTLAAGKPLPAAKLEAFVRDTRHAGVPRRLAYEWLLRVDATASDRLLPGMLNDPGQELRRDAVAVLLKDAQTAFDKKDPSASALYKKALDVARDRDQLTLIANRLNTLNVDVDMTRQFGFITQWMLAGPFDNVKGVGFQNLYPPDKGVDLKTAYVGKEKAKVQWQEHTAPSVPLKEFKKTEELGLVDLNKIAGNLKGAVYFGYTAIDSPAERPVQIRAGSNNAVRIYLNGKEIYFREEYHHGMQSDQHIGKGLLKAGRNEILIKVCQNEQTESWAQQWSFQLRVSDDIGGAVPVKVAK